MDQEDIMNQKKRCIIELKEINHQLKKEFRIVKQKLDDTDKLIEETIKRLEEEEMPNFGEEFENKYEIGKRLGKGGFGTVYEVINKTTRDKLAVKYVPQEEIDNWGYDEDGKMLPKEYLLLKTLKGIKGVCQLIDFHENNKYLNSTYMFVINTPREGMNLKQYLQKFGRMFEPQGKHIILQIIEAIKDIYCMGIIHRDIKLENIMYCLETEEIMIIDFGGGDFYHLDQEYDLFVGLPTHSPPEIIIKLKSTLEPSIVWGVGIIIYEILQGKLPFANADEVIAGMLNYKYEISNKAREFISKCLHANKTWRPKLMELNLDNWFKEVNN